MPKKSELIMCLIIASASLVTPAFAAESGQSDNQGLGSLSAGVNVSEPGLQKSNIESAERANSDAALPQASSLMESGNSEIAAPDILSSVSSPGLPSAAGVCSVVDAFVAQFCSANPNDITCQFQ